MSKIYNDLIDNIDYEKVKDLFNLVAPIQIYFLADVEFFNASKKRYSILKKEFPEFVSLWIDEDERHDLTHINQSLVNELYNLLIERIVHEEDSSLTPFVDSYGAMSFSQGMLCGDEPGTYAFYSFAEDVVERVRDGIE